VLAAPENDVADQRVAAVAVVEVQGLRILEAMLWM
jgi:hypothetical protein